MSTEPYKMALINYAKSNKKKYRSKYKKTIKLTDEVGMAG